MYAVTFLWTSRNLIYYVCDLTTSKIVLEKVFRINHAVEHLENYDFEFIKSVLSGPIFSKFDKSEIKLVMFVVPAKLPLLKNDPKLFVERATLYLYGKSISNVRFVYSPFFDATRALIKLQSDEGGVFESGDDILMVRNFFGQNRGCDESYVYLIRNTQKGWRAEHMSSARPVPQGVGAREVLAAVNVDVNAVKHLVIFEDGHKTAGVDCRHAFNFFEGSKTTTLPYYRDLTMKEAVIYLNRIYTNNTVDFSTYVPVCFHWKNLKFMSDKRFSSLCFSYDDVLPCTKTMVFTPRTRRDNVLVQADDNSGLLTVVPFNNPGNNPIKLKFCVGENGSLGFKTYVKKLGKDVLDTIHNGETTGMLMPFVTITNKFISATCFVNGISTDVVDVNGLTKIPLKVSFMGAIPVVGSAVTEPVKYGLDKLLDEKWVARRIKKGATDLVLDKDGKVYVILDTLHGLRKTAPITILAVICRSIMKLAEKQCGNKVTGIRCNFAHNPLNVDYPELIQVIKTHSDCSNFV